MSLSGLATGLLKNTTGTGVPSIAGSSDVITALGYTPLNPSNLTTIGAVPYINASGSLSQDQTAGAQFFWDSTNHRLGLGTVSPGQLLYVNGNSQFINNANFVANGIASIGAAGPQPAVMLYMQTAAQNLLSGSMTGLADNPINTPTSASTATNYGITTNSQWKGTASSPSGTNFGINAQSTYNGSGSLGTQIGGEFQGLNISTGTLTSNTGGYFYASNQGNGTVTSQYDGYFTSNTSGTSTTTNDYGAYIANPVGGGTVTNRYQLYLETPTVGGTKNYAIYSAGGVSYLAGSLAVGNTGGCQGRAVNCFEYDNGFTASPLVPYALGAQANDTTTNNGYVIFANAVDNHTSGTRSQLSGALIQASSSSGTALTSFLIGMEGLVQNNGGTVSTATAITAAANNVAGTTTDMHALDTNGVIVTGGTVTNAVSVYGSGNIASGGGAITNSYGFYQGPNSGNITGTNYGMYLANQAGIAPTNWNLYSAGTGSNYFGGPVTMNSSLTATSVRIGANSVMGDFVQFTDTFDGSTLNATNWAALGTVTQSGSLSITGTSSFTANGVTSVQSYRRSKTLTLTADIVFDSNGYTWLGWTSTAGTISPLVAGTSHLLYFPSTAQVQVYEHGSLKTTSTFTLSTTTYRAKISVNATGATYWISADAGDTWTQIYDGTANNVTDSPLYAAWGVFSGTQVLDNVSVDNGADVLSASKFIPNNLYVGGNLSSGNPGSGAPYQLAFQPGLMTSVLGTKGVYGKVSKASTVDNLIGSAISFTCAVNPTVTMYECGTSSTCASPTTIGTVTITASGQAFAGTVSSAAITAGDYVGWAVTAGTCTSLDLSATTQVHTN